MFTEVIKPRFLETDALGHINNNSFGAWYEAARDPLFKLFLSKANTKKLNLVMAHSAYDFLKEVFWGKDVIVKTAVSKIGNSSIHLIHAVYQNEKLCATGKCILICYNLQEKHSISIPFEIKAILQEHLFSDSWPNSLKNE